MSYLLIFEYYRPIGRPVHAYPTRLATFAGESGAHHANVMDSCQPFGTMGGQTLVSASYEITPSQSYAHSWLHRVAIFECGSS
jgi:hypothetical protein